MSSVSRRNIRGEDLQLLFDDDKVGRRYEAACVLVLTGGSIRAVVVVRFVVARLGLGGAARVWCEYLWSECGRGWFEVLGELDVEEC